MPVEFGILGPLEVHRDGSLVPLRAPKLRRLLAGLLVRRGEVLSIDTLIDDLWSVAPPRRARHALEMQVSRLRDALGDATPLLARPPGYVLEVQPERVDVGRFEGLLDAARRAGDTAARASGELAGEALALWRGDALADFRYEPFAQSEIARLEELRWDAIELRVDADLRMGRTGLVAELEALVRAEPLRERLRAQLMLALYRSGRQAEALAVYRRTRRLLMDELGIEPGEQLRGLHAAMLRQDAELSLRTIARPPARRTLGTVLVAELVPEELALTLDPEPLHEVLAAHHDLAAEAVSLHGGTIVPGASTSVTAIFGVPTVREDDASRAVSAGLQLVADGATAGSTATPRVGVATSELLLGPAGPSHEMRPAGPASAIAARLVQAAAPGEVVVDEVTAGLVAVAAKLERVEDVPLPGPRTAIGAFRISHLHAGRPPIAREHEAQLVGRDHELGLLRRELDAAVTTGEKRTVVVSGAAGIGKTRLVLELARRAASSDVVIRRGRCLSFGDGGFAEPLRELLGSPADVSSALAAEPDGPAVAARLATIFDPEATAPADELPWAFRRYCAALARQSPIMIAFDDLHWASPPLLDLVHALATTALEAPVLLVCLARDELTETRPGFAADAFRVELAPLSEEGSSVMVEQLVPAALDVATLRELVAAAEGNPLFLEQLAAHVAETGRLEPPPTLQALLAARLERLGPGERSVLEHAAVIGREPTEQAISGLLDAAVTPTVASHVETLVTRGFLQRATPGAVRFRHGLVREAAYRAVPKLRRAELHERLADWLSAAAADDEQVGYHLERAFRLRVEIGSHDRGTLRLSEDAGRRFAAAGFASWKRNDVVRASEVLERAAALLPPDDAQRRAVLCELGVTLASGRAPGQAKAVLAEAVGAAVRSGDRATELRARLEQSALELIGDSHGSADTFLRLVDEALPVFEGVGDHRSLGRAWMLSGWVRGGVYGRHEEWERAAERALDHYTRAGWPPATCIGHLAAAAYWGPVPAPDGIARCEQLLARYVSDLATEANVSAHLGGLHAMLGDFHRADELVERARTIYEELGRDAAIAATVSPIAADVALLEGDPAAAAQVLGASCERLLADRRSLQLATRAGELAAILSELGLDTDAARWCDLAERHAPRDDVISQLSWRRARALIHAAAGAREEAAAIAREAVEIASRTDATNLLASIHAALAGALAGDAAAAELLVARGLYERTRNDAAVLRLERCAAASLDRSATSRSGRRSRRAPRTG